MDMMTTAQDLDRALGEAMAAPRKDVEQTPGGKEPLTLAEAVWAIGEEHSGWSNQETWLMALHLNNDQGMQDWARGLVTFQRAHKDNLAWADGNVRAGEPLPSLVADKLRDACEDHLRDTFESRRMRSPWELLMGDVLMRAMARVNWPEVVEGIMPEE